MKFVRRIFLGLVFVAVAGFGIISFAQRDQQATHLALGNLTPLISVNEFFAKLGVEWGFEPSSDGKLVSYWKSTMSGNDLKVKELESGREVATISAADRTIWSPRDPVLLVLAENRFWEVDPYNPDRKKWVDVSPRGINAWNIVRQAAAKTGRNLVFSYDSSQLWPDLYSTEPSGRDLQIVAKNDGTILDWMIDAKTTIKGRTVLAKDSTKRFERVNPDGSFTEILKIGIEDSFQIFDMSEAGDSFIALTNIGADKSRLVRMNAADGALTPVAGFDQVDVSYVYDLKPLDGQIDMIVGDALVPEFKALTPAGEATLAMINSAGNPVDLSFMAINGDGRFVTTTVSPEAKSYSYRHFDLKEGKTTDLGDFAFRKKRGDQLAATNGTLVAARDGLLLPVYVTRPIGVTKPGPTVIEVHGGPEYHRRFEYSHNAQFLANRGYTVISVNYRGSNGWGRAFRDSGYGKFGTKIQEDIVDVAAWAVAEKLADPAAMAVTGDSFGGYSTVMALTRDDNPFKAGLAIVPLLDVEFQTRNAPAFWGLAPQAWARYFGDYEDPAQAQVMEQRSPVNLAARVKSPLLIFAGRQDHIVNIEQVERFDEAMKREGGALELRIFDNEGHGWDYWKTNVATARLTEDFLAKHLGGRSGGWDWVELAADWLD